MVDVLRPADSRPRGHGLEVHYILDGNKGMLAFTYTVKPVVTTTSEQRPPANNNRPESGPTKFRAEFPSE
jgi:hypothetical protein